MKKIDQAYEVIKMQDIEAQKHRPYLNQAVAAVERIDNKISWLENNIKALEEEKQIELKKVNDLFELALVSKHELPNGYTVKTDNRHKIEVEDVGEFLKWLKANCEPNEVLEFFKDALKVTKLKSFCDKKINRMKSEGKFDSEINIGGIKFFDVTFRRLTTEKRKKK